ncbi:hypothetical protein [Nitrosopumilus ureiphilus]|uniref:Uncharacterized protein n=1 Tax=Nitrosopumilus ureiphilus TaxID=1470067 RepID=A0A7D5R1V7_9ARCH|nr:hypothetical protein [Nitrosopumilus ureiphilus]QLH06896.1 hypothetical protein C5F50_07275 [Nitrosopumilus ureiphilus]
MCYKQFIKIIFYDVNDFCIKEINCWNLDQKIKEKLSEESDLQNTTLNSLISQILAKHVERGTLYRDIGFMSIRKSLLKILFNQLSDSCIKQTSQTSCKEFFKETALYLYGNYDRNSVIKTLDSWFDVSNIPCRKIINEESTKIIVHHELGDKWTLYFETMIKSIFDELDIKSENFVKTTDSISFKIYK